jgi:serine/threonine protein kinase
MGALNTAPTVGQPGAASKASTHRGFSPEQIAQLKELEEKTKVVRMKQKLISKQNPLDLYRLQDTSFGKGSVGEVFFGTRITDGKKVAIKKLEIIRRGRDRLPLILREIDIISTSQHPNIVQYFGSHEVDEHLWVVMEFMSAGSLYDIVKNYPNGVKAREEDCAYVVREVTKALAFMHDNKRIHRDIKVDNILLDLDGSVKLADFGTAVQLTFQRLRRNTLAGTPYYMAPELIQRIPYGEKVDVWSLGITVVEMMTGGPPFYDLDPQQALDAIVKEGVVGLEQFPGSRVWSNEIMDFVNIRCLCVEPDKRQSCAELLKHPFLLRTGSRDDFKKLLAISKANPDGVPDGDACTLL